MGMDLGRWVFRVCVLVLLLPTIVSGNVIFRVQNKFKGRERSLNALRAHDARRHGRLLSAVDLFLGGNGSPTATGFVLLPSIVASFGSNLFNILYEF